MKDAIEYQLRQDQGYRRWHLGKARATGPSKDWVYGLATPHPLAHRLDHYKPHGPGIIVGSEGRECFHWRECSAKVYEIEPNLSMISANINISANNSFTAHHLDHFVEEQVAWVKIVVNAKTQAWCMKHWDWIMQRSVLMFFEEPIHYPVDWDLDTQCIKFKRRSKQWLCTTKRRKSVKPRREIAEVNPFINI